MTSPREWNVTPGSVGTMAAAVDVKGGSLHTQTLCSPLRDEATVRWVGSCPPFG